MMKYYDYAAILSSAHCHQLYHVTNTCMLSVSSDVKMSPTHSLTVSWLSYQHSYSKNALSRLYQSPSFLRFTTYNFPSENQMGGRENLTQGGGHSPLFPQECDPQSLLASVNPATPRHSPSSVLR